MNDRKLLKMVTEFRNGIVGSRTTSSKSLCFMVCWPLQTYLEFCGYSCHLVTGEIRTKNRIHEHCWLQLEDSKIIIDPTADQFNGYVSKPMPKVYIGIKPRSYRELVNR
jgi:hypothetical protein